MTWARRPLDELCRPVERQDSRPHTGAASLLAPLLIDVSSIDRQHMAIARPTPLAGAPPPGLACTKIREGDVLLARERRHLGIVAQVPASLDGHLASARLSVLRPDPDLLLPRYLFYICQADDFVQALAARGRSEKTPAVPEAAVRALEIPLPPLSEQHHISALLDQAWSLRTLRARASARAERVVPALITRMFGSPARWGAHAAARPLGDLVDVVRGATPAGAAAYWQGPIPWVSPGDMDEGFVSETAAHVTEDAVRDTPLVRVAPGAVLLAVRGGRLAREVPVALAEVRLTIGRNIAALVPGRSETGGAYLWAALKTAQPLLHTLARGTAGSEHAIDMAAVLRLPVVVPDGEQARTCEAAVQALRGIAARMRRMRHKLDQTCAVLLHRACSGALTARWREATKNELLRQGKQ